MRSQESADLVKNAVRLAQDEVVGKVENDKAGSSKPSVAAPVPQGPWEVRSAVGLDDEACVLAKEIHDKRSDGMLTAEFGLHDLPVT